MPWLWKRKRIRTGHKTVDAQLAKGRPWSEGTARLFACDCAEHVIDLFENCYPEDFRLRQAIALTRQYAREPDRVDLLATATNLAKSAASQVNADHKAKLSAFAPDAAYVAAAAKVALSALNAAWEHAESAQLCARLIDTGRAWTTAWMRVGAPPWAALSAVNAEVAAANAAVGTGWIQDSSRSDLADDHAAIREREWQLARLIEYFLS